MATKKAELHDRNRVVEMSRKVALAYVGAFGVVGDEFGKMFGRFVDRGEQMGDRARKLVRRNDKQVRQFAEQIKKEQKATAVKANKKVKKAIKRVEHALA